jgi:hypothetical protein
MIKINYNFSGKPVVPAELFCKLVVLQVSVVNEDDRKLQVCNNDFHSPGKLSFQKKSTTY